MIRAVCARDTLDPVLVCPAFTSQLAAFVDLALDVRRVDVMLRSLLCCGGVKNSIFTVTFMDSPQHLSRKDSGSFWIPADRSTVRTVHTLFITESAIDALSAFSMPELRNPGTVFLSATGAGRKLPAWAEAWKPQRIVCAFDADDAGDEAANALAARDPRTRRLRPEGGKDWNAVLVARHPR